MSKKEQLANLAVFIRLRAAHEILIKLTKRPESTDHLEQEADTYGSLSFDLAEGNWNNKDIEKIKELAKKRCSKKLDTYKDITDEKYNEVDNTIDNILIDLGLL